MAKNNYDSYTREQLIAELKKLNKRKKYGLVWEEEKTKEKFEADTEGKLPVLVEDTKREINTDADKPTHILIEGDNYHALSVLNYTHAKSIDVIYIDPPYNTGARDWKYNNDYVETEDAYRHSKWLSFMNNRLKLTKKLLSPSGVLVCSIDHNEQENLGILLRELFPEKEISCITLIHNPSGIQGKNFSYNHEFAYFVYPRDKKVIGLQNREHNPDIRPLRDVSKGDHLRTDAANCFYPVFVKNNKIIGFGDVCEDSFHPKSANVLRKDGVMEIYPIDPQGNERKWVFARQTVENIKDELTIEFNKQRKIWDVIRKKVRFNYKTVWDDKRYNANIYGTQLLASILNTPFPFPKSLYTVKECIQAVIHNKDRATILDFFAGSGTTGHAVLELNKEDGGNRKFILCTNNENNICTEVCYPRIKKVIKGYTSTKGEKVKGFGENLKYYITNFVSSEPTHRNKKLLTDKSIEMLCLKENTFDEVFDKKDFYIFKSKVRFTAILFNELKMEEFKKEIKKLKMPASIYVFSLEGDDFREEFEDLQNDITLCSIPEAILKVYRRIYGTVKGK